MTQYHRVICCAWWQSAAVLHWLHLSVAMMGTYCATGSTYVTLTTAAAAACREPRMDCPPPHVLVVPLYVSNQP